MNDLPGDVLVLGGGERLVERRPSAVEVALFDGRATLQEADRLPLPTPTSSSIARTDATGAERGSDRATEIWRARTSAVRLQSVWRVGRLDVAHLLVETVGVVRDRQKSELAIKGRGAV